MVNSQYDWPAFRPMKCLQIASCLKIRLDGSDREDISDMKYMSACAADSKKRMTALEEIQLKACYKGRATRRASLLGSIE